MQFAVCAFFFAAASAGNNIAARMAMMAMTTSNSIKVKAFGAAFENVGRFIILKFLSRINRLICTS